MTTKARLKYFDSNNNPVVIGTLNGDNGSGIDELTLRNSGRQYTNVVVSGSQSLFGSFPTKSSEVTTQNNADGPEIFLEVFNQSTNQFKIRDRVYAESQGVVSNNGQFKHKRLYGFEKFTGRQRVEITNAVTTDIEDVLQTALPTGYTVQAEAPSGGSIPSVSNYTFKGKRSEVYKALQENYDYLIFFTGETDSNDDYIVRLEPRGFGGQVDTFEKGVDPVFFEKWTKNDELRRITEAEVIGTNSNNQKVQATASTSPNNGRFTRKNVTYIENQSEAKDIAVSLIAADSDGGTPQDVEHGRINAPIDTPPANNLNKSVQVINNEINVDDLFTVVEQKDFFHQSQVMYSFEFEKELTAREQQDKKDLGNRNAELITDSQTDVGNQSLTTGSAKSNTGKTGGVGDSGDRGDDLSNVGKTGGVLNAGGGSVIDDDDDEITNLSPSTSFQDVGSANPSSDDAAGCFITAQIVLSSSTTGSDTALFEFRVKDDSGTVILPADEDSLSGFPKTAAQFDASPIVGGSISLFVPNTIPQFNNVSVEARLNTRGNYTSSFINVDVITTFHFIAEHDHGDNINTDNNRMGLTDDIGTDDKDHGGGSGDNQHGGSTESNVKVDIANEEQVNR